METNNKIVIVLENAAPFKEKVLNKHFSLNGLNVVVWTLKVSLAKDAQNVLQLYISIKNFVESE